MTLDSKAVSPLIGFILMLAIIMGFIGIVQSKFVPEWNKAVEAKHFDRLSYEVADLSEAVTLASSTGNAVKVVLDAGVSYPNYYVLLSPSKAATTVSSKKLNLEINGKPYSTYAVIVQPNYLYSSSPKLVFEHSAVLKVENSKVIVDSDQNSFTPSKITIYLINTTFKSLSSTENINLIFYPVSYGGVTHYDSLTITFQSYNTETADWWVDELTTLGFSVTRNGDNITVTANDVDLSISYIVAFATSAGSVLPGSVSTNLKIVNLSEQQYSVYTGTTIPLGVRVVDDYNNPVRNVEVSISDSCDGSVTKTTDENGEVWYYFSASSSGSCQVTFSVPLDSFTYEILVSSPSGGGGIFSVEWNVSSFNWNVSLIGSQRNFEVSVYYGTDPVAGAVVDISTDAPSLISYPESVTTDQYGKSVVTVTAKDNGTAHLFATAGGSGDVLELIITGAGGGFCPAGWQYWREIAIQNNVDYDLTDYQVKIVIDTQSLISAGKMRSDCGDIRFYDEGWNPLSYWIEEDTCDTTNTIIWVKVPNIPASGTVRIYMIYGNSSATSESDGETVFNFFDDFESGTLDYSKWYVAWGTSWRIQNGVLKIRWGAIGLQNPLSFDLRDGYILESKIKYDKPTTGCRCRFDYCWCCYSGVLEVSSSRFTRSGNDGADATILYMRGYCDRDVHTWIGSGNYRRYDVVSSYYIFTSRDNTWYVLGDEVTQNTAGLWKDYNLVRRYTVSWAKEIRYISIGAFQGKWWYNIQDTYYDWVRIRKFVVNEPEVEIGPENAC